MFFKKGKIMPRFHSLPVYSLLFTLLFLAACSEDPAGPENPDSGSGVLVTLHLNPYTLSPAGLGLHPGFVFATDSDGNILDQAEWTTTETVILNSTSIVRSFAVTIAKVGDRKLRLFTEVGLRKGAERTYLGYAHQAYRPTVGGARITVVNPPAYDRFVLTTNWMSIAKTGIVPSPLLFSLKGISTDLFLRVEREGEVPIGGMLKGIELDDDVVFNFDEPGRAGPLRGTTVQVPSDAHSLTYNLHGLAITDSTQFEIDFDWGEYPIDPPTEVTLYAPEYDTSQLVTTFVMDDYQRGYMEYFTQESVGPVPSAFEKLPGEIEITGSSIDSASFTTSVDWDRFRAYFTLKYERFPSWHVEGLYGTDSFSLPPIPPELQVLDPDHPREDYELRTLEIFKESGPVVRSMAKHVY
jgi:hypothetical protein